MEHNSANTPRVVIIRPTNTKILPPAPHPHINRLLHQLPQQTDFALNSVVFGYRTLQSSNLLDVVCEPVVVELVRVDSGVVERE